MEELIQPKLGRLPPIPDKPRLIVRPLSKVYGLPVRPSTLDNIKNYTSSYGWLGNNTYGDCITPEVRVLTADLKWVPAGQLKVGDKLIGFDEEPLSESGRYYRESYVETTNIIKRPVYELEFDDGTIVRSSEGHKWLAISLLHNSYKVQKWIETKDMPIDTKVIKPLEPWKVLSTFEAGYLAAAFDGEGNLEQLVREHNGTRQSVNRVNFAQVDNQMLSLVKDYLSRLGFKPHLYSQKRGGNSGKDGASRQTIHRLSINNRPEWLKFLGSVRPARLLSKLSIAELGRMNGRTVTVSLIRKTFIGEQEVVYLNTSTRTYFAEGLASHNCVIAAFAHHFMTTWATLLPGVTMPAITTQDVLNLYWIVNPDHVDRGCVTEVALDKLLKYGIAGIKPYAWAAVAHDWDSIANVDNEFVAGIYGMEIDQAQYYPAAIWDYVPNSTKIGGHEVSGGAYDPNYEHLISWSMRAKMTPSYVSHKLGEHHVIIWPHVWDNLSNERKTQLATDYKTLTGKAFPVPVTPEVVIGMPSAFEVIEPKTRFLDTRIGLGIVGKLVHGVSKPLQITGISGIPANATSVAMNVTVTKESTSGYVSITSEPVNPPPTSDVNFPVADTRANLTITGLDSSGRVWVTFIGSSNSATTDVIGDVSGFFVPI